MGSGFAWLCELRHENLVDEDEFREMRRIFCNILLWCQIMDDLHLQGIC